MNEDRIDGAALIAGSLGTLVTMSLHPTGHELFVPGQLARATHLAVGAHALAIACLPVSFLGALALSRRLASPDRLATAALVTYAFAVTAAMNAAVVSGLVGPRLVARIVDGAASEAEAWRTVFRYNGHLNQAFARVLVVASSAAIVLWSAAILRVGLLARGVGFYGCVLGPLTVAALLSGHLRLDVHGFGLVVLGQALWFIAAGTQLLRHGRPAYR